MFNLLESFAINHNAFAPNIYKTLILLLMENRTDEALRETLLSNFESILTKLKYIPITVFVEPLVKQAYLHGYNTCDMDLFVCLVKHKRLEIKPALLLTVYIRYSHVNYYSIYILMNVIVTHMNCL
jgi:hypothetical protein